MSVDVDVLIPVRDGGPLLRRAVDSVLDQDGASVRVIIVHDDATDPGVEALPRDPRIVVLRNSGRGVTAALETALHAGDAPFVARQDADDESLPGRFAAQLEFFEAHPGIGLVGTAFEVLVGDRLVATMCESPAGMLERNPLCAGSVLVRREVLERAGGHRLVFSAAEDYDCWLRCAWVAGVAVLPVPGYRYKLTASMATIRRHRVSEAFAELARASHRARMDDTPDPADNPENIERALAADATDPAGHAEFLAWWAREFAALGARNEGLRCVRAARGLSLQRRARLLADVVRGGRPQAVWS